MRTSRARARRSWLAAILALALAACARQPSPVPSPTATPAGTPAPSGDVLAEADRAVAEQLTAPALWDGPTAGARRARQAAEIDYVAADETNGGVMAVYEGVRQAAAAMGWPEPVLRDGGGTPDGRAGALRAAVAAKPAAIILGGFDPSEQGEVVSAARSAGIVLLGWHAGSVAGADTSSPLFTNVSTRPAQVALLAADYVIHESRGTAGVAIFTDSQYGIALDKANLMKAQLERCAGCEVLSYRDVPIALAASQMPAVLSDLRARFGSRLTHLLAINGNYFSEARPASPSAGSTPTDRLLAVAAGDGDQAEFDRIRSGDSQIASVAEPLYLQGWQLVDEANRALAGAAPSGYVPPPGLITRETVPAPGLVWDPTSAYQDAYRRIWGVAP